MAIQMSARTVSSRTASSSRMSQPKGVKRDVVVDVARAICLFVVVLFHGIMMGLQPGPTGLQITNAFDGQWFFPVLSLFLQVMPLFFILGGFSIYGAWQRRARAGATAGSFIRERLLRLARPAVMVFAAVGGTLAILSFAGVPADLLGQIGFRISQPMWFLAVYIGCSAMVPLMAKLHERAPRITLAALALAVLAVDGLRQLTGLDAVGLASLAFVWLLMQQLGFFAASRRRPVNSRLRLMFSLSLTLLLLGAMGGWWSLDMLQNLNPPRFALILLGMAQRAIMELLRPQLERISVKPRIKKATEFANSTSLTVYLWHASVMSALLGVLLACGTPMPEPLSPAWWATGPLWLTVLLLAVIPVAAMLSRFEKASVGAFSAALGRKVVPATLLAVAAVVLVLAAGANPSSWLLATAALATSLGVMGAWPGNTKSVRIVSRRYNVFNPLRGRRMPL